MTTALNDPLELPCGATLPNRLAKAAMTEGLADRENRCTDRYLRLYEFWQQAGVGLSLSGNIQVDRRYLERAGNIAIDANDGEDKLAELAAQVTADGTHFWAQLSHAGRQSPAAICEEPLAPSPIRLEMPGLEFNTPRQASEADIRDIIVRFANAAAVAKRCGFTGVEIHGAHGYLISSFLSPLSNQRSDQWGGSLQNRSRLLVEVLHAIRDTVGPHFPVCLKMNSADFQRGGFTEGESLEVLKMLDSEPLDMVEISGGNYEALSVLFGYRDGNGNILRESTRQREAYFLDFAAKARGAWRKPLMITGGFRNRETMSKAVANGELDVVGIGRPLICNPAQVGGLLDASVAELDKPEDRLLEFAQADVDANDQGGREAASTFGQLGWFFMNIYRLGDGREMRLDASLADALQETPPREEQVIGDWNSPWN